MSDPNYVHLDTYLCYMKTKLTLSIDRRKVAKLRRASIRKGTSISELVEDLADDASIAPEKEGEANIMKWRGFWSNHLNEADYEADDRAGSELRKTLAFQRLQRERRKRA